MVRASSGHIGDNERSDGFRQHHHFTSEPHLLFFAIILVSENGAALNVSRFSKNPTALIFEFLRAFKSARTPRRSEAATTRTVFVKSDILLLPNTDFARLEIDFVEFAGVKVPKPEQFG